MNLHTGNLGRRDEDNTALHILYYPATDNFRSYPMQQLYFRKLRVSSYL